MDEIDGWKETVARCCFTDRLDSHLLDFLRRQKPGADDEKVWRSLYETARRRLSRNPESVDDGKEDSYERLPRRACRRATAAFGGST